MILSFSWLETLNIRNWTNGNLMARVFGIPFWNEINPGFCFLFIRPGFWSEERQIEMFHFLWLLGGGE